MLTVFALIREDKRRAIKLAIDFQISTELGTSDRRGLLLFVIINAWTGTDQITIAIDVVDAIDGWPVLGGFAVL